MNTKEMGIIISWNEARCFGFVATRSPDGQRRTYFLHSNKIKSINTVGGIPQLNDVVYFDVQPHPKGPVAIRAEVVDHTASMKKLAGAR